MISCFNCFADLNACRSSKDPPKRNKKPRADDVVNSCEETIKQAAAASRLRYGPAPQANELVIYRPFPEQLQRSLYYRPTTQTLHDFIVTSLHGNELLQQDSAHRATRVNAVKRNISQFPTKAFPRIAFNDDMVCFTNGVLLISTMQFYAYDGNIDDLDAGGAASPIFEDQAYHPDSPTSRQWQELHRARAALKASGSAPAAAASTTTPTKDWLLASLGTFFGDDDQPLKITR